MDDGKGASTSRASCRKLAAPPLHAKNPKDFLRTLSPMGTISSVSDIANAVVYLTEAGNVTGEVMHVDGGSHQGRW